MGGSKKNRGSGEGGENKEPNLPHDDEEMKDEKPQGVDPETSPLTSKQQESQSDDTDAAAEAALTQAEMRTEENATAMSGDGKDKSSRKFEPYSHNQSVKDSDAFEMAGEELEETQHTSVGGDESEEQGSFDWLAVIAEEKKNLDLTLRVSKLQRSVVGSQSLQTANKTDDITQASSSHASTSSSEVVDQFSNVFDDIPLRDGFNLGLIYDDSRIEQQDELEMCAKFRILKFSPCSSPTKERKSKQESKSSKSSRPETSEKQRMDAQFDELDNTSAKKCEVEIESYHSELTTPETPDKQLIDTKHAEPSIPHSQRLDNCEAIAGKELSFTDSCQQNSTTKDEPSRITSDVESSNESQLAVSMSEVEYKDANGRNTQTMEGDGVSSADELVSSSPKDFSPENNQLAGTAECSVSSERHSCETSSELNETMFLRADSSLSPQKEDLNETAAKSSETGFAVDGSSSYLRKLDLTYGYEDPCEEKYKRYKLYLENVLNFNVESIVMDDFEDRLQRDYYFLNRLESNSKYFIMEYLFAASECLKETVEPASLQERSANLITLKVQEVISEARRTLIHRIEKEPCLFHEDFSAIFITKDSFKPIFTQTWYDVHPDIIGFARNTLFSALLFYGLADLCSIHCRPEQCITFAQLSYALTKKLLHVVGCADAAAVMTHLLKQKMVTAFLHEDLYSDSYYCMGGPAYETIMKCFKAKVQLVCSVEIPNVLEGEYPFMELDGLKEHVIHCMSDWTNDDQLLWENTWLKLIQIVTTMKAFYSSLHARDEAAVEDFQVSYQNLEKYAKVLLEYGMLEATSAVIGYYGVLRCVNAKYLHSYEERCAEYKRGRSILVAAMELEKQQRPEFSFPIYALMASNGLWLHLLVVMDDMWCDSGKEKVSTIVELLISIFSNASKEICDGGAANESISVCAALLLLDYTHDMPSCLVPTGISDWRSLYLRTAVTRGARIAVLKRILFFLSYSAAALWTIPRNRQSEHQATTYLRMLKIFSLSFSAAFMTQGASMASFKTEVKKTAQSPILCSKLTHARLPAESPTYGLEMLYLPSFLKREVRATSEFRVDHLTLTPTDESFKTGIEGGKRLFQRSGSAPEAKLFDDVLRRSLNTGCCGDTNRSTGVCGLKNNDECYDIGKFRQELRSNSAVNHIRVTSNEIEKLKFLCCVKVIKYNDDDDQDEIFNHFLASVTSILKHVETLLEAKKTEAECPKVKKTITRWRSAVAQAVKICECGATNVETFLVITYKFCLLLGFQTKPFLGYLPRANAK